MVADRAGSPAGGRGHRILRAGADRSGRGLRGGVVDRASARRPRWRAGLRPHSRWPALLPLHRRQVQSRRDPAAALGARWLRLPCRLAPRPRAALDAARFRARLGAVGEVFRGRAGGAVSVVPAVRPRCAQSASHSWPMDRARGRAPGDGAAPALAGAQRFSSLRLCERARCALARPARSRAASGGLRGRPTGFSVAGAADRRGARVAAAQGRRSGGGRRRQSRCLRSADRDASRVWTSGNHHRAVGVDRARRDCHVGLSAVAVSRCVDRALCPCGDHARANSRAW